MKNPWHNLKENDGQSFILESDREAINDLNQNAKEDTRVRENLLPGPYAGNPFEANVVLLLKNPGYHELDDDWHSNRHEEFVQTIWKNLRHEEMEYPFYYMNPKFQDSPGWDWWNRHLQKLIERFDPEKLSKSICSIEWFPYHSRKAGFRSNFFCESQGYSFDLLKRAIGRGALVLILRAEKYWMHSLPELNKYHMKYIVNSTQSAFVSPGNTSEAIFQDICKTIEQ